MPGAKLKITDIGEPKSENGDMGVHKFVSIKPLVDPDSPPPIKLEDQEGSEARDSTGSNRNSEKSQNEEGHSKKNEAQLSIIQLAQKKMKQSSKASNMMQEE